MLTISKPLFVYLQRPDTRDWVTVGRYQAGIEGSGYRPCSTMPGASCWRSDSRRTSPCCALQAGVLPETHKLDDFSRFFHAPRIIH